MKASEIIDVLQKAIKAYGDLEVVQGTWSDWDSCDLVKINPQPEECKPHIIGADGKPSSFITVSSLDTGGYGGGPRFHEPYQTEIKSRKSITVLYI
jgi:hypothetical protein